MLRPVSDDDGLDRGVMACSVVIRTLGRSSLGSLLRSLLDAAPAPTLTLQRVVLVDHRPAVPIRSAQGAPVHPPPTTGELQGVADAWLGGLGVEMIAIAARGIGPAHARDLGIAATATPWVVVLDEDVTVTAGWWHDLALDLSHADPSVGAVFARTPGDTAIRRRAVETASGFHERLECDDPVERDDGQDRDLVVRLLDHGWRLETGRRTSLHPSRTPGPLTGTRVGSVTSRVC